MFQLPSGSESPITVLAGHWTDPKARTGCTVILFDGPASAVADVRGGAPGTRETDLLAPGQLVSSIDAILLTGGSAFGLNAAGGVMAFLRDHQRGVTTSAGPVPIVPAAVIFDLSIGEPSWPTPENAIAACRDAVPLRELERGQVGAGTGATIRKMFPGVNPVHGGVGMGHVDLDADSSVTAIAVVNAAGDVLLDSNAPDLRLGLLQGAPGISAREATTLLAVILDAPVDQRVLHRAATAAHCAIARKIRPSHTIFDGDTVFAVGLRIGAIEPADVLRYSVAVELAVERAIIDAVTA